MPAEKTWDGLERRTERQNTLFDRLDQQDAALASITTQVSSLTAGFPHDDPHGHRAYHEAVIKRAEEKAEFWRSLRLELAKWGLIAFAGWAIAALWHELMKGPK